MSEVIHRFTSELGQNLELHAPAVNHIVYGDLSDRIIRENGVTTLEKIIKGGLHTYDGWCAFAQHHPEVVHLGYFDSELHKAWFYARELQNGVITLRLPKYLFNSPAAKITQFPDNYYKSGYLWKTLFPMDFNPDQLGDVVEEALNNINREATQDGEIVGYARVSDPLKTIRVVILYRNNVINSVFPSWTQPNTGNNGKVYSHFENIGHVISASTAFYDSSARVPESKSFIKRTDVISTLVNGTPVVFLKREKPEKDIEKWSSEREEFLLQYAIGMSEAKVNEIISYVTDHEICKNHDLIGKHGYSYHIQDIENSIDAFNAFQVHQNIIEALVVLHAYDNAKSTNYFYKAVIYITKNMATYVGVDSWVKRRIFHKMAVLLGMYHDFNAIRDFIVALSEAPSRREWFVEFSFDTQMRKKLQTPFEARNMPDELIVIYNPSLSVGTSLDHFIDYMKENLGENYLLHFNDDERTYFVRQLIRSGGPNYVSMIRDVIRYTGVNDFRFFPDDFDFLMDALIKGGTLNGIEDALHRLMRDYCRIQTAQRFRLNLLYKKYLQYEEKFEEYVTADHVQYIILKHERIMNTMRVEQFLSKMEYLSGFCGDQNLVNEVAAYREKAKKEVPPPPEPLPRYISERYTTAN